MQPPNTPLSPEAVREAALDVIRRAKFPMLATTEASGQPRVRPISPLRVDGFTVYFANLRRYGKTSELAANPNTELCYLDEQHHQVRITGTAQNITNEAEKADLWATSPLLRKYLGSLDNPDLLLYKIQPSRVRYMQEWALDYYEIPLD